MKAIDISPISTGKKSINEIRKEYGFLPVDRCDELITKERPDNSTDRYVADRSEDT